MHQFLSEDRRVVITGDVALQLPVHLVVHAQHEDEGRVDAVVGALHLAVHIHHFPSLHVDGFRSIRFDGLRDLWRVSARS